MSSVVFETTLMIEEEFTYLMPQKDEVKIALYDDDTIFLSCNKLYVDIKKGKTKHLVFSGKGSKVQKRLIDKSLTAFFALLKDHKIEHNMFK